MWRDHETLRHILDEMAERLHAPSDYAEKDFQFHYTVVRASRNMVLVKLFTAVQDVLKLYLVRALAVPGVPEISHDRHQRIAGSDSVTGIPSSQLPRWRAICLTSPIGC